MFSGLVIIDQLSKYIIRQTGGFYICNPDIAFGINIPPIIFWAIWIVIIALLLFALYKKTIIHPPARLNSAKWAGETGNTFYIILILAGAISNLIDRLYFGCIIDFIDLKFWPVFNLADVFITLGTIFILYSFIKKEKS